MTDSFPLTAAELRKHASEFHVYEHQLALELGGLSGLQINELAFARLTKPDPLRLFGSDCGGEEVLMLGTDQRDMLVPKLAETLLVLPPGGYVLDIGSGNGQTTSYALEGRSEPLCFVPVDPMEDSLERYQDLFRTGHPNLDPARDRVRNRRADRSPDRGSGHSARVLRCDHLRAFDLLFLQCPGLSFLRLGPAASGRKVAPRVRRRSGAFHRGDDPRLLGQIRAGSRGKGAQIADCAGSDDRAGERDAVSVGLPGVVAEGLSTQ
jgi:hypothetical protein